MSDQRIQFDVDQRGVAMLTLNHPEKHNAFDDQILKSLVSILDEVGKNPAVRILVLQAVGKNFSAGADLEWMRRMAGYSYFDNIEDAKILANVMYLLNNLPQATIVRVQGAAFGGALGLIACCDMAVASSDATFCLSEVKLGIIPAVISPYVVGAIGARAAKRYFQTAEVFNAAQALNLGLVSEISEQEMLDCTIEQRIEKMLLNGPIAMKEAKALVNRVATETNEEALIQYCTEKIADIRVSEEGQEGLRAFLEKRSPKWCQ